MEDSKLRDKLGLTRLIWILILQSSLWSSLCVLCASVGGLPLFWFPATRRRRAVRQRRLAAGDYNRAGRQDRSRDFHPLCTLNTQGNLNFRGRSINHREYFDNAREVDEGFQRHCGRLSLSIGHDSRLGETAWLEKALRIGHAYFHLEGARSWINGRVDARHLTGKGFFESCRENIRFLTELDRAQMPFGHHDAQFQGLIDDQAKDLHSRFDVGPLRNGSLANRIGHFLLGIRDRLRRHRRLDVSILELLPG